MIKAKCESCGNLRTILQIREAIGTPIGVDVVEHARELLLALDPATLRAIRERLESRLSTQERGQSRSLST